MFDGVVCSSAAHTVPASACVSATRRTRSGHTHCVDREGERGEGDDDSERNGRKEGEGETMIVRGVGEEGEIMKMRGRGKCLVEKRGRRGE